MIESAQQTIQTTQPETIAVTTPTFFCQGASDGSGHPRVYLTFTHENMMDCPYCGQNFTHIAEAK